MARNTDTTVHITLRDPRRAEVSSALHGLYKLGRHYMGPRQHFVRRVQDNWLRTYGMDHYRDHPNGGMEYLPHMATLRRKILDHAGSTTRRKRKASYEQNPRIRGI